MEPPALIPPGHQVSAGRLRPARPEVLPLRTEHAADPLRALLQAATGMSEEETALVQILARPATGAAVRRARRAARRLKAGQSTRRIPALSALLLHRPQPTATGRQDVEHSVAVRQSASKLAGPQWQTIIAYAATCTAGQERAGDLVR
ncbi:type VI secretion protein, partial [Streptomyces sp. MCAF7]